MAGTTADLRFIALMIALVGGWIVFNSLFLIQPPPNSGLVTIQNFKPFSGGETSDQIAQDCGTGTFSTICYTGASISMFLDNIGVILYNTVLMQFNQPELLLLNSIIFPLLLILLVVVLARFIWPAV